MNDKSIVVINTPKNCRVCPFRQSPWTFCLGEYEKEKHCPLRPLPQKKKPLFDPNHCEIEEEIKIIHEIVGYNRCIDEIMGETKSDLSTDEGWWRDYELYEMQND